MYNTYNSLALYVKYRVEVAYFYWYNDHKAGCVTSLDSHIDTLFYIVASPLVAWEFDEQQYNLLQNLLTVGQPAVRQCFQLVGKQQPLVFDEHKALSGTVSRVKQATRVIQETDPKVLRKEDPRNKRLRSN